VKQYIATAFTVPAGTTQAAPFVQAVALGDEYLESVRLIIPPGHSALTGLRITWSGTQIVPINTGAWHTGDNEIFDIALEENVTARGLSLAGYNLDIYPHSFTVRWVFRDPKAVSPVMVSSPQLAGRTTGAALTAGVVGLAVTLPQLAAQGAAAAATAALEPLVTP
jgi:hypothetical protein